MDREAVAAALPCSQLIDALKTAFTTDVHVPGRAHHDITTSNGVVGTLLLMPAWSTHHIGVKVVTVFPGNTDLGIPAVAGSYLLMSAATGGPVAIMDGTELTLVRTAAASALASSYLSRPNSVELLMVGTGNLAPYLIDAHANVRPVKRVRVWGRSRDKALQIADCLNDRAYDTVVADDLEEAVRTADIVCCATLSSNPLIRGDWLRPGQHVDLVGAFKPNMAEADVGAIERATVFVDTRAGALADAGEIVQSIVAGRFSANDVKGSLRDLASENVRGRTSADEITLFKSVGTALEDLAAAELAMRNHCAAGRSS